MTFADKCKTRDIHYKIKRDVIDLSKKILGKSPDWIKFDEIDDFLLIKILAMTFYVKSWEYYTFLRPTIKNLMEHREESF